MIYEINKLIVESSMQSIRNRMKAALLAGNPLTAEELHQMNSGYAKTKADSATGLSKELAIERMSNSNLINPMELKKLEAMRRI